jgi:hypothetical protein
VITTTATEIQTVAAVVQALAAAVFLGSVVFDAKRRARLREQERRDKVLDALLSVWRLSAPTGGMTGDEAAGILSQRQIEFLNCRLAAMGENWKYPFKRV